MNSLQIKINIKGEDITFHYFQNMVRESVWSAKIIDECKTVEEILAGDSAEECQDRLVTFVHQFGDVTSVIPIGEDFDAGKLREKLMSA